MSKMRIEEIEISNANIFENLLDNFPDMIHSVNDTGQIIYANRTAESLVGYTRDELLSMNIRQIYADSVLKAVDKGFSDLKKQGDKTVPESLVRAKDGTEIPVEIRSFSIYDDNYKFVRTFSILRDLRKVKELQQELIHAGRLAAIGELASGVAHDIKNPLTVIKLTNGMIVSELEHVDMSSDTTKEHVKSRMEGISKASNSIQKLVDHLRNFSRGMAEEHEILDLYDAVEDALFIVNSKIKTADVNILNEIKRNIHFISGSQNQIEQVFVNLLANACDAITGQPKRDIRLSISPCQRGEIDCWKCDITDTGAGIPKEFIKEIFRSFFTTKEKGKGTGLGLSIARGVIRDHKGDIEVVSEGNNGTTFSVYIPQAKMPNN